MKKIEAIFPEDMLDNVKVDLENAGFIGKTIFHVKGRGQEGAILLEWRAGTYKVDFLPKILLMIIVPDEDCDRVVRLIQEACKNTLEADGGDEEPLKNHGKIFISTVDQVVSLNPPVSSSL